MAIRKKDQKIATLVGNEYVKSLQYIFVKSNIEFIKSITRTSSDTGFHIFKENSKVIDALLGRNTAINKVRKIIENEEISPYMKNGNSPNWNAIEVRVKNKYDSIGLIKYYGNRMLYSIENEKWEEFCRFYKLYFQHALTSSEYSINEMSWVLFLHCSDTDILKIGLQAMQYTIAKYDQNDDFAFDTYANLLYRSGFIEKAIEWEKKALNVNPSEKTYIETLQKMRLGVPTWQ
jgi:tetratricopeptide (TPR) repeat protein